MKRVLRSKFLPESWRLWLRRRFLNRDDELEHDFLEEDESNFHTRRLLSRAHELRIPVPPMFVGDKLTDDYRRSGIDGHRYYLSMTGEQKVRSAIRDEEKYKPEQRKRRLPYVAAFGTLVAAGLAILTIFEKWPHK